MKIKTKIFLVAGTLALATNYIGQPALAKTAYISWLYPKRTNEIWRFFGHHKANFVSDCPFLANVVAEGMEIDALGGGEPIRILPDLGNDHFLDTGFNSPGYGFNVSAAVIMNHNGKIFSAAALFSTGLSIFVRNKNELPLATKTFHDWANGIWQHAIWESQTGPHFPTTIYVLKGYGDQSVN